MKFNIRLLYLYLFSFVGLIILVIGAIRMVDLGLKIFVFKGSDVYDIAYPEPIMVEGEAPVVKDVAIRETALKKTKKNRQREASSAIAMIAVGLPLYLYHWKLIAKEK